MAFHRNNTAAAPTTATTEKWEARGYLNAEVTLQDGSTMKIDALKLLLSNEQHVALSEHFEDATPVLDDKGQPTGITKGEQRVAKFMRERVKWVYRSAERKTRAKLVLED